MAKWIIASLIVIAVSAYFTFGSFPPSVAYTAKVVFLFYVIFMVAVFLIGRNLPDVS